ncbi:helix-turn-helix domain-containing protein [Thiospirochaeta perfilievii]|uniref:Helix-turn-helix domain-containing protein n=1 Tax=Thiospirochaeta perfilievii TaxID=252967 RepID=A0A5C1QBZ3_9SPIO|nr:helix-turn-helix domain-containing protein [Thiospirochaeta perfilievii]QEN04184.1 helix-turn-helix domain-containing protein [Thiospirochaeta perfilievii]
MRYFEQNNIKLPFSKEEKLFIYSFYSKKKNIHKYFTLIKPETILYSWKKAINNIWTYNSTCKRKGRPQISYKIRNLIKSMKVDNYLWGCLRIRDELIKLNIDISRETIRKIISDFRKQNIIKPNYSWSTFLRSHWNSLFACDFFTVDFFVGCIPSSKT